MRVTPLATRGRRARALNITAVAVTAAVASAGCVPAARYHEPRASRPDADAPTADATAAALVGEWRGNYDGPLYGRRGTLRLSLRHVTPDARGTRAGAVAGTATGSDGVATVVDSARVGRGRVVLWLAPFADAASGNTVWVRLDGALAADTLGGRLRVAAAATVATEHAGWRVVRVGRPVRTTPPTP